MALPATRLQKCLFTVTASLLLVLFVAATAQAQTQITTCTTIDQPGRYILANDLSCMAGDGIDIAASEVELNLNGHLINGSLTNVGIETFGVSNVRVIGPGTVNGFSVGVLANFGSRHVEVTNVTVAGASGVGFSARFATVTWRGNAATNNPIGFQLLPADDSEVTGNRATGNAGDGFAIGGAHNRVHLNTSLNNGTVGIDVTGTNNEITSNIALGNTAFDLADMDPNCSNNKWVHNRFGSANQSCIH